MVPHEHLLMVLAAIKAPKYIITFLKNTMGKWKTRFQLSAGKKEIITKPVTLERGLFQGDALSPLLFCLAIAPMSTALNNFEWNKEYPLYRGTSITHLFYMDDLKLYAPDPKSLKRGLNLVYDVSDAIGMKLGLKKCAIAHLTARGKTHQQIEWEQPF